MRAALFVATLIAVPIASAHEVQVDAMAPFRPDLAAGLTALATAMQQEAGPCSDLPAGSSLCAYALNYFQATTDAVDCIIRGDPLAICLETLSGIACLTFHVGTINVGLSPISPSDVVLDLRVPGAGVEMQVGNGVSFYPQYAGFGTYRLTTSSASECAS